MLGVWNNTYVLIDFPYDSIYSVAVIILIDSLPRNEEKQKRRKLEMCFFFYIKMSRTFVCLDKLMLMWIRLYLFWTVNKNNAFFHHDPQGIVHKINPAPFIPTQKIDWLASEPPMLVFSLLSQFSKHLRNVWALLITCRLCHWWKK